MLSPPLQSLYELQSQDSQLGTAVNKIVTTGDTLLRSTRDQNFENLESFGSSRINNQL